MAECTPAVRVSSRTMRLVSPYGKDCSTMASVVSRAMSSPVPQLCDQTRAFVAQRLALSLRRVRQALVDLGNADQQRTLRRDAAARHDQVQNGSSGEDQWGNEHELVCRIARPAHGSRAALRIREHGRRRGRLHANLQHLLRRALRRGTERLTNVQLALITSGHEIY